MRRSSVSGSSSTMSPHPTLSSSRWEYCSLRGLTLRLNDFSLFESLGCFLPWGWLCVGGLTGATLLCWGRFPPCMGGLPGAVRLGAFPVVVRWLLLPFGLPFGMVSGSMLVAAALGLLLDCLPVYECDGSPDPGLELSPARGFFTFLEDILSFLWVDKRTFYSK